ncbi:hypothetical protein HDU79_005465 [Rhizoclosmatium sp. JEL0117]|nr:hypothetical protein HDU79_005465 [Rhizoclosmatium sp. JEL0117]
MSPVAVDGPRQRPMKGSTQEDAQETARGVTVKDAKERKEVWWINGVFVALAHVAALVTVATVTPKWQTVLMTFVVIVLGELGITMGYHRLWSHRAYTGSAALRVLLAFMGTLGFQGSIKWWVLRHRLHHRYTDDAIHDPYSATRGFWFSHMGWIFEKPTYTRMGLHHEFPKDYRNGIHPLDWDPTKWLIFIASRVGLASNLYVYPENEISKARVSTAMSKLEEKKAKLDWGPKEESLPLISSSRDVAAVSQLVGHEEWMVLDGFILDVSKFRSAHPGGEKLIDGYMKKDATKAFYGMLNNHSKSARTMVEMLRVAKVVSENVGL